MDAGSLAAIQLLEAIGAVNERLIEFAVAVRRHPAVRGVVQDVDVRGFQSGTEVNGYVDAELGSGEGLGWWFEVWWGAGEWIIGTQILFQRLDGVQDVLREWPTRRAAHLDEFLIELREAVDGLVASAHEIDLSAPVLALPAR